MTRLLQDSTSAAALSTSSLAQRLQQRLIARPQDQCLLDFILASLKIMGSESCGKCTPCRAGLEDAADLVEKILEGIAELDDLEALTDLAHYIHASSDCAIGYESGALLAQLIADNQDEFTSHIQTGQCSCIRTLMSPCQSACPAHINIPGYIALVQAGRYNDALRLIRNDNPLPAVCGYVCEHPCELVCRRYLVDDAINICGLKRFADDNAKHSPPPRFYEDTNKSIAIIGGGPAGLTCAYFLRLMGHNVHIFERHDKLGGMTRYGIPDYRLPPEVLDRDINHILATGVKAFTHTSVGSDISFNELAQRYDAVYISIGAQEDKKLGIEGEDATGVMSAVEFLDRINSHEPFDLTGKRVVIIGGGNVAMDCTRSAKRLNPLSVECVYRRRIADMTALPEEIHEAFAEGCQISELLAPVAIKTNADHEVIGLEVQEQMVGPYQWGRPKPCAIPDAYKTINADVIIVAIGQAIDTSAFAGALSLRSDRIVCNPSGAIVPPKGVDEYKLNSQVGPIFQGGTASAAGALPYNAAPIYAGGDAVFGPSTVIKAIAAGKLAAANIDEALGFKHHIYEEIEIPAAKSNIEAHGRVELQDKNFARAATNFELAKLGMKPIEAQQECARCLRCDHFGFNAQTQRDDAAW